MLIQLLKIQLKKYPFGMNDWYFLTMNSPQTREEEKNQKLWKLMAHYLDTGIIMTCR